MSLRTYPLIAHPAFLAFVEHQKGRDHGLHGVDAVQVPTHRPEIKNITDVADYLQISHFFLRTILRRPWKHYRIFRIKKRSGGEREICSPRTFLKVIQWWILDTILYNAEISNSVHGFVPYKSFKTNAQEHVGATHIVNVDIKDFFPSITTPTVASVFESLGYSDKVSLNLAKLTTFENSLPQGAPTSPAIANLALRFFDEAMKRYAEDNTLIYTRYADDLTFSSSNRINESILNFISINLQPLGMKLNDKKTKFMGPNMIHEVTGIVLGRDGIRLPAKFLNGSRGWFMRIARSPELHHHEIDRMRGTLALIKHVGGAGSASVVAIGERAIYAVQSSLRGNGAD